MEHLAAIYLYNSGTPSATVKPSALLAAYVNNFTLPLIVGGVRVGPGETIYAPLGLPVYAYGRSVKIGTLPAPSSSIEGLGIVRASQSPNFSPREISPVDGVPRIRIYNYLEIPLEVVVTGEVINIPAKGSVNYDGPSSLPYVPLGTVFKTNLFPEYRLMRPYDTLDFGL